MIAVAWQDITTVVGLIGLIASAVVALWKIRPETESIVVESVKKAIDALNNVIDALQEELVRTKAELEMVRKQNQEYRHLLKDMESLKMTIQIVTEERDKLLERIATLQAEVIMMSS